MTSTADMLTTVECSDEKKMLITIDTALYPYVAVLVASGSITGEEQPRVGLIIVIENMSKKR
jgi:hypothetical protein